MSKYEIIQCYDKSNSFDIYSIRRNIDGQIFSVGQVVSVHVKTKENYFHLKNWIISRFEENYIDDVLTLKVHLNVAQSTTTWFSIENIIKLYNLKQILCK